MERLVSIRCRELGTESSRAKHHQQERATDGLRQNNTTVIATASMKEREAQFRQVEAAVKSATGESGDWRERNALLGCQTLTKD